MARTTRQITRTTPKLQIRPHTPRPHFEATPRNLVIGLVLDLGVAFQVVRCEKRVVGDRVGEPVPDVVVGVFLDCWRSEERGEEGEEGDC